MEVNYCTVLYWFCHTSIWIRHRYTHVPHPKSASLLPPRTVPLGRPSAPAPSIQYHASNLDWRFISYMILYMFQRHSPKSSNNVTFLCIGRLELKYIFCGDIIQLTHLENYIDQNLRSISRKEECRQGINTVSQEPQLHRRCRRLWTQSYLLGRAPWWQDNLCHIC